MGIGPAVRTGRKAGAGSAVLLPVDPQKKLAILADAAKYDASCASSGGSRRAAPGGLGSAEGMGICHSYTPDGRCVSLLKILLTNFCIYDCTYCVNRISSDTPRARFTPEEVVSLTLDFYRRNYIEGLFLSSGVLRSPDHTMEELVRVARLLREDHGFAGYIHLKVVPGAAPELIEAAGLHADRLSANVELPTEADLARLAPEKKLPVIDETMGRIHLRRTEAKEERRTFAPAGQSTQIIVGATDTPDATILATSSRLYETHRLRRVYYSAFSPIPGADVRLPAKSPPLVREHRLYEADWLIRFYGFEAQELAGADAPQLDLGIDPKLAWALRNRAYFPVDLNIAPRGALLRVPGIGVRGAERIVEARRHRRLRIADLGKLRVAKNRALPFVVAADHNPTAAWIDRDDLRERIVRPQAAQLSLFDAAAPAAAPEPAPLAPALSGEL